MTDSQLTGENIQVQLALIALQQQTQTRVTIDDDTVSGYAEDMEAGDKFPAVILFRERVDTGENFHIGDGFHRIEAARKLRHETILATVRDGTRLDALQFALGANRTNGLRRTNADKRKAVLIALENFPYWASNRIAENCGVSNKTVDDVRRELGKFQVGKRVGKDGKERALPTRKAKPENKPYSNWMSIAAIAAHTGVSVEAVRLAAGEIGLGGDGDFSYDPATAERIAETVLKGKPAPMVGAQPAAEVTKQAGNGHPARELAKLEPSDASPAQVPGDPLEDFKHQARAILPAFEALAIHEKSSARHWLSAEFGI